MSKNNQKKLVYIIGSAEIVVIIVSLAYAFLGIFGRVEVTIPIYFFWLLTHYFVNALFFVAFWKARDQFNIRAKGLAIVWAGLVGMWYLPAAVFFVLTMNLSKEQTAWTNFVWMWELLGIGGTLVGGYAYRELGKFHNYLERGIHREPLEKLYSQTLKVPRRMGVSIILVATLGYFIAALQFSAFASHPMIEQVKFVLHGFVTSLFVAIFYYYAFDQLLGSVRKKIELSHDAAALPVRNYSQKVLGTTIVVVFAALCYLLIVTVQLLQLYTRSSEERILQDSLNEINSLEKTNKDVLLKSLTFGPHGKALFVDKTPLPSDMSENTNKTITEKEEGIIDDYQGSVKLIGFKTLPEGQKIVSIIYLEDFYAFSKVVAPFGIVFLFILTLTSLVAAYSSRFVTRAVLGLKDAVKEAIKSNEEFTFDTYTADELEELSHTFSYFVNESIALRKNLSLKIEEKTKDLKEAKNSLEAQSKDLEETKRAIINLLEDIEESKKAVEAEKAKDEALLSSILEGMIAIDSRGRVIHINEQAVELLGFSLQEAIGEPYQKIIVVLDEKGTPLAGQQNPIERSSLEETREVSSSFVSSFIQRKNGLTYPASIIVSPIKYGGSIAGKLIVFRDITLEREIDRMKSEFISLASHQLRTPLSAMKWFLEMLLSGDIGAITPQQRELLENVNQSNERMISLVRALLNISRIESGRLIIDPHPTDMNEFIESILKEIAPQAYDKKINLIASYHHDLPKISIDEKLIREVFVNLLSNAVKYTPTGGEVTVFISKTNTEVIFQVSDRGIGIPKQEQGKVFEKFFRASNVIKRETDGSGLGLYLAKIIIAASGGRIWFESSEEKGTTFWFSLPLSGTMPKKGEVSLDTTAKI